MMKKARTYPGVLIKASLARRGGVIAPSPTGDRWRPSRPGRHDPRAKTRERLPKGRAARYSNPPLRDLPLNVGDQSPLPVSVSVDIALGRLDRGMAGEQLHV